MVAVGTSSRYNIAITGYTDRLHAALCNSFDCYANEYAQAMRLNDRSGRRAAAWNCEHNSKVRYDRTCELQSVDLTSTTRR